MEWRARRPSSATVATTRPQHDNTPYSTRHASAANGGKNTARPCALAVPSSSAAAHPRSAGAWVGSQQLAIALMQRKVGVVGAGLLQLCRGRGLGEHGRRVNGPLGRRSRQVMYMTGSTVCNPPYACN